MVWLLLLNKNLLYSILAILIGINTFNRHFKFKKAESINDGSLKVMTYNVKNLSNNNLKYADSKIRHEIQEFLTKQNADLICLQEFQTYPTKGINTVADFKSSLKMPYHSDANYVSSSTFKFVDLMVTYSRYPIINHSVLHYQQKCYALINDIVIGSDTIRLFNLHLESNHFAQNEYEIFNPVEITFNEKTSNQLVLLSKKIARYSQIRNFQVNQIHDQIQNSPFPVVICGDFNDTPAGYAYHKLAKNLKDSFVEKGKGYGNTYNGKLPAMRIDYILTDTTFQIRNFVIGNIEKSDHYPVISSMDFRPTHFQTKSNPGEL